MNINRFYKKVFLFAASIFVLAINSSCLKKNVQNDLIDQKIVEEKVESVEPQAILGLKEESLAVSEPAARPLPTLEEVVSNTIPNETFEENNVTVLDSSIDDKNQLESTATKNGVQIIQEHYGKALSFYDANEYDKAKEELKICLKMTADLDLDIEILFRFGDVYKDVFESTASQEAPSAQNDVVDTTIALDNVVQEEKAIAEGFGKAEVLYDYPVEFNEEVKRYIKLFITTNHKATAARLARSTKYIGMMKEVFKSEGLPQDLAYLPLLESAFKTKAYSRAGAAGLWQFMRKTGQRYGLKSDWSIDERYDPVASTRAAAKYLKDLHEIFDCWLLAEAAYNAGEYRILRAMGLAVSRDFWYIASKKILAKETKGYVAAFMANLIIAKNPEKYGFTNIPYEPALEYDEVVIENCMELSFAARLSECSVEELKSLNPALLKWCTPIDYPKFVLNIPKGKAEVFNSNLLKIANVDSTGKIGWVQHVVKTGETMSTISWKYSIPISAIAKANNITNINIISVGTRLFIPYGKGAESAGEINTNIAKNDPGFKKIVYVVQSGDTLWEISKKYNIPMDKIREWNADFSEKKHIYPGEKLAIWVKEEEM